MFAGSSKSVYMAAAKSQFQIKSFFSLESEVEVSEKDEQIKVLEEIISQEFRSLIEILWEVENGLQLLEQWREKVLEIKYSAENIRKLELLNCEDNEEQCVNNVFYRLKKMLSQKQSNATKFLIEQLEYYHREIHNPVKLYLKIKQQMIREIQNPKRNKPCYRKNIEVLTNIINWPSLYVNFKEIYGIIPLLLVKNDRDYLRKGDVTYLVLMERQYQRNEQIRRRIIQNQGKRKKQNNSAFRIKFHSFNSKVENKEQEQKSKPHQTIKLKDGRSKSRFRHEKSYTMKENTQLKVQRSRSLTKTQQPRNVLKNTTIFKVKQKLTNETMSRKPLRICPRIFLGLKDS